MKKTANRKGANIQLRKYSDKSLFAYIDYVNSVAVELTSGRVYATGGDSGARQVGFDDPIEGSIKLSTQIVPIEFVALACSPDGVEDGGEIGVREKLTATEGKVTLTKTPVAGTIYVYKEGEDITAQPAATAATGMEVTIEGAQAGDAYIAYYIVASEEAKSATFNNDKTPGCYIIYGDTVWKDTNDTVSAEHFKAYKAMPQKSFSITYPGSGDTLTFEMTFDLMEDEDGNVYTSSRI
jgi:hypothetical protein